MPEGLADCCSSKQGDPRAGAQNIEPGAFPECIFHSMFTYPTIPVPTDALLVVDLFHDRMDGQIAACCLQGIVNRSGRTKVYVINTYCRDNRQGGEKRALVSERFLSLLYGDIPAERLMPGTDRRWPSFLPLLDRLRSAVKGLIVWDPAREQATIEAATTIAGQTDGLPVSPELADALSSSGLPIIEDLRSHRFAGNLECLSWMLERWFPKANHRVAFTWSHMTNDEFSWGAPNKDFVVAHRLFTFFLNIENADERRHYIDVLRQYAPGTPVMGWAEERFADPLFCTLGYFMVPYIGAENVTVHSSFPSSTGSQPPPRPAALDPRAVYVALQVPDGDNLLHTILYEPDIILNDPAGFGKYPVTWVLNPGVIDLAPRLYDWYLGLPNRDQEFAAQMGDGHPSSERYAAFSFYCKLTREYMGRAGMRTLKQMAEAEPVAWNVRPYMLNGGYLGPVPDDMRGIGPFEYHMDGNTFHIGTIRWRNNLDAIRQLVREAPQKEPLFLNIYTGTALWIKVADVNAIAEALIATEREDGRHYVFLRSMDLAATYRALIDSRS
jgi:hypothetical protein